MTQYVLDGYVDRIRNALGPEFKKFATAVELLRGSRGGGRKPTTDGLGDAAMAGSKMAGIARRSTTGTTTVGRLELTSCPKILSEACHRVWFTPKFGRYP